MSIRIQNESLAGAAAPGAGRTDEISNPSGSSSQFTVKPGHRAGDSVDISSLSQNVVAAGIAQDAHQTGRIKQLTALYRSGQYSVDAAQVSRAMVSQALGDGSNETI